MQEEVRRDHSLQNIKDRPQVALEDGPFERVGNQFVPALLFKLHQNVPAEDERGVVEKKTRMEPKGRVYDVWPQSGMNAPAILHLPNVERREEAIPEMMGIGIVNRDR